MFLKNFALILGVFLFSVASFADNQSQNQEKSLNSEDGQFFLEGLKRVSPELFDVLLKENQKYKEKCGVDLTVEQVLKTEILTKTSEQDCKKD